MPKIWPVHYALGMAGVAVIRNWMVSDETAEECAEELRLLANRFDEEPSLRFQLDIPDLDVTSGYRLCADTYDDFHNPLIRRRRPRHSRMSRTGDDGRTRRQRTSIRHSSESLRARRGRYADGVDLACCSSSVMKKAAEPFLTPPLDELIRQSQDQPTSCRRPASEASLRPSPRASRLPCIRWSAAMPRPRQHSAARCAPPWSGR